MTERHIIFIATLPLLLFVLWLVSELAIAQGASDTAHLGSSALLLAHCGLGWIMIYQLDPQDLRAQGIAAIALLLMPVPVYSLLYLMDGLSGFALAVAFLLPAGALATAVATARGIAHSPLLVRMPAGILLQFLPPLWLWSERSTLLSLVHSS